MCPFQSQNGMWADPYHRIKLQWYFPGTDRLRTMTFSASLISFYNSFCKETHFVSVLIILCLKFILMPESSIILDSYTTVQCFKPYLGNNKFVFRKLRKYSLTWLLHNQKSSSTCKIMPSRCPDQTWELTKLEETLPSESFRKCKKYIMCTTAEGKAILLDKPDGYSWKEWHQKSYISTTEKKLTVEEIQNKRHIRPSCALRPFFLFFRSRPRTAAALCWITCGLAFPCCRGADISINWSLHFGLIGTARRAAALAAAMFGPAWAGSAGPRLHEDNRAVVLWTEVRTVWRAVLDPRSGKLDLNRMNIYG